jgi:hypothetical protein
MMGRTSLRNSKILQPISIGNEDDQLDLTEGWSGTTQTGMEELGFGKGNRGIEADNFE